jgi:hypothetical protein
MHAHAAHGAPLRRLDAAAPAQRAAVRGALCSPPRTSAAAGGSLRVRKESLACLRRKGRALSGGRDAAHSRSPARDAKTSPQGRKSIGKESTVARRELTRRRRQIDRDTHRRVFSGWLTISVVDDILLNSSALAVPLPGTTDGRTSTPPFPAAFSPSRQAQLPLRVLGS